MQALVDGQQHQLADVPSRLAETPQQRVGLQAHAMTRGALGVRAVAGEQHADVHLVGFGLQPCEEALHPVPNTLGPFPFAVEHPIAFRVAQISPRGIEPNGTFACKFDEIGLAFLVGLGLPWLDRAPAKRQRGIRYDQGVVHADHSAKAATCLARAQGRIEAERAGIRITIVDVAIGTMQARGESPRRQFGRRSSFRRCAIARRLILDINIEAALTHFERGFDRLPGARRIDGGPAKPVLNHLERVIALCVDSRVALRGQQRFDLCVREIARDCDRECQQQARVTGSARPALDLQSNALRAVATDGSSALTAVQDRRAGEQQLQMIVQLRHGAHGGTRRAHGIGLIDRDRWGDAVDTVHLRLVHSIQELTRVGGEGLDITSLTFGVQGVENQRRLSRSAHAGDNDQFVEREVEVQAFEVVLTSATDAYRVRARRIKRGHTRYFTGFCKISGLRIEN